MNNMYRVNPEERSSSLDTSTETSSLYSGVSDIQQRLQDAMKSCHEELGDDYFQYIMKYKSPEEVIAEIDKLMNKAPNSSLTRFLRHLKPHLVQVQTFILGVTMTLNLSSFQSVCIWGLIALILQYVERSTSLLSTMTEMWSDIGNNLDVLHSYGDIISADPSLTLVLVEVLVELQKFALFTARKLSHTRASNFDATQHISACKERFQETSRCISERINYVKERIAAQAIVSASQKERDDAISLVTQGTRSAGRLSSGSLRIPKAKLPCYYIPFPPNTMFCGRQNILNTMQAHLGTSSSSAKPQSVAPWSPAGMGKTQVALEYAPRARREGLKAIFWIDAEGESEWKKAFTEIANMLELDGCAQQDGHETNRLLVLQWLQETNTPWLLILDNVEDPRVIRRLWPYDGPGTVIMTCRSDMTASSSPATLVLQVEPLSAEQGGELLLIQAGLSSTPHSSQDMDLSAEFSALLGGHAISLNVMARSIIAMKMNLGDFLTMYKQDPRSLHRRPRRRMHNLYYDKPDDLESMWAIPFSRLDTDVAQVFGVMAMCGPSQIPSIVVMEPSVFKLNKTERLEIIIELRDLALLSENTDATSYSVHRLIQGEYRNYIGVDGRLDMWRDAVSVLRQLFPKQHKGFTMFNQWPLCERLIDNIEGLAERYHELSSQVEIGYNEDFAYLISDAARYLTEVGRYNACLQLLQHGFHHCRDEESIPHTNLCVMMGHVFCERGQDKRALKYNDVVLRVRQLHLDPMHSEVANALSNSALSMVGCGQNLEGAAAMLKRSLDIDLHNPPEDHSKVLHLRHFNTAFALRALGRIQEARGHVDLATRYSVQEFGDKSRYLTISYRMYADFDIRQGHYESAWQNASKAHEIARTAGSSTPWVAAALFYMGDVRLRQSNPQEAIHLLDQARIIAQIGEPEKTDKGEYARVIKKLSQAYFANGQRDIGHALDVEAESIYRDLMKTGEYSRSDDEKERWDYLVCLKFR